MPPPTGAPARPATGGVSGSGPSSLAGAAASGASTLAQPLGAPAVPPVRGSGNRRPPEGGASLGGPSGPIGPRPSRAGVDPDATAIAPLPPALRIGPDGGAFVPPVIEDAAPEPSSAPVAVRTANLVHRRPTRRVLISLVALIVTLLVLIPSYLLLRESGSGNPSFAAMNGLGVPTWARQSPHDAAIYSRFCVDECQISERDAGSARSVNETQSAYGVKLRASGWTQTPAANCTTKVAGSYTCWLLDARELDLWVRPSTCSTAAPPATETGIPPVSAPPSTSSAPCVPTSVQIKVFDQIERSRVRTSSSG
jgi:hypothetical protein